MELAMRVHVDRLDPLSVNHHREFLPLRLLAVRAFKETAGAKDDAGSGGRTAFKKITACGHDCFLPSVFLFLGRDRAGGVSEGNAACRRQDVPRHVFVNGRRARARCRFVCCSAIGCV
jgi:hypothetical protein